MEMMKVEAALALGLFTTATTAPLCGLQTGAAEEIARIAADPTVQRAMDVIVELEDRIGRPVVLIERKYPPPGWALPGGFVDVGESLERAALREAWEETSLRVRLQALLGCYSDPARDPRSHTISTVYLARASGSPVGADDAARAQVFQLSNLPEDIVFDHRQILRDYAEYRESGRRPPARR